MTNKTMPVATRRKVALVVDDEQVIANTLTIILNNAGFDAHARFSGEESIADVDQLQPDLLITDVIMGRMTGIELAIGVRSKLPNCKILLFSGQAATADLLAEAKSKGHNFDILRNQSIPPIYSQN